MQTEEKNTPTPKNGRGHGVPFGLVALLVILALLCGGALGYLGGANFSKTARELEDARAQIGEYELTLMELYSDQFEAAARLDEAAFGDRASAALSGGDFVDEAPAERFVVAEFDGGEVMSDEAMEDYQTALANHAFEGADVAQDAGEILEHVLEELLGEKVAHQVAHERGYVELTDDDRAQIADVSQAQFDETVAFYLDMVREEGMTDEAAYEAAVNFLAEQADYTIDTVIAINEAGWWQRKLYDAVTADVAVSPEEITAAYNERAAAQEALFTENPEQFEFALLSGEMILYHPAGYRSVKHIFFELDFDALARADEIMQALETEEDEAVRAELAAELDALYVPAEARANEVLEQLQGGADFDAMMREYSDDADMNLDTFASTGYLVSADSVMWSDAFIEACMALENPGDLSTVRRTESGAHIFLFMAHVEPGAVPLSKVNAEMTQETLENARFAAYHSQLDAWIAERNAVYYPERILEQ
ncbi:MAG: peptidylprolyl isomerase [Christensenellales bacterium]|jgi:hypothetical protein